MSDDTPQPVCPDCGATFDCTIFGVEVYLCRSDTGGFRSRECHTVAALRGLVEALDEDGFDPYLSDEVDAARSALARYAPIETEATQ